MEKKVSITLVPDGGLCNRLNAIASALAYKESHPCADIRIFWHKWYLCNCHFRDLFKQRPSPYVPVHELGFGIKDMPANKLNLGIPKILRGRWYDYSIDSRFNADSFDDVVVGKERIYVNRGNRFCRECKESSLAEIFIPVDEIGERIHAIVSGWHSRVVGLHIRRTDNVLSINQSPINHFYDVIDMELDSDPEVRFYVATDDNSVKEDLKYRYGNHIITFPLNLSRNSARGMKDAVVDLFCLGSAEKIYGSSASTYSTFAASLYDKEIII